MAALAQQVHRELAAGGGFARPLQAAHHDDRRPRRDEVDVRIHRPHQVDQLVVDDLDHQLARLKALDDLLAEGFGDDVIGEVVDDFEIHIRL